MLLNFAYFTEKTLKRTFAKKNAETREGNPVLLDDTFLKARQL